MGKLSRRHTENLKKIKNVVHSSLEEAINLLQETATAKFIESVELHANLNIDPKYADQQLRTTLTLPHGVGKSTRIAVLTNEANFNEANAGGADIVGSQELIDDISQGTINFDLLVATPDMMPKLAKLGRVLGPKGLMPSPKAGTVSTNLTATINEFKKGKLEYRADKTGIVHISFGKASFSEEQLIENLSVFYDSVLKNKPTGVKGKYVRKFTICSTMGPGVIIDEEAV